MGLIFFRVLFAVHFFFPPTETTIIFDWDDTLLSSSWLAQNGLRLDEPAVVPAEAVMQLDVLQESVISLLNRAVQHGTCIIITNAETGWVELSCKKFMPKVLPCLTKIRVLSARSNFESLYPDSPSDWKVSRRRLRKWGKNATIFGRQDFQWFHRLFTVSND